MKLQFRGHRVVGHGKKIRNGDVIISICDVILEPWDDVRNVIESTEGEDIKLKLLRATTILRLYLLFRRTLRSAQTESQSTPLL